MLRPLADSSAVSLKLEPGLPSYVQAGEDDLYQIVFNLVENGIKYNVAGGSVTVCVDMVAGQTRLVVEDSGIGIPANEMPHIFERFYKSDKSRSLDKNGVGLGLYIVKTVINLHHGEITVRSVEGEYCEF